VFLRHPLAAQEQTAEKPKPAAREYGPFGETGEDVTGTEQSTGAIQPDSLPASGMQNLTLGTPPVRHSYVVPGIQYGNTYSSGSAGSTGTGTKPGEYYEFRERQYEFAAGVELFRVVGELFRRRVLFTDKLQGNGHTNSSQQRMKSIGNDGERCL